MDHIIVGAEPDVDTGAGSGILFTTDDHHFEPTDNSRGGVPPLRRALAVSIEDNFLKESPEPAEPSASNLTSVKSKSVSFSFQNGNTAKESGVDVVQGENAKGNNREEQLSRSFTWSQTKLVSDSTDSSPQPYDKSEDHLVAIYELSVDTKPLDINNAQQLFHPIVFSHFYQRIVQHPHSFDEEFEKIAKSFKDLLDDQFSTQQVSEVSLSEEGQAYEDIDGMESLSRSFSMVSAKSQSYDTGDTGNFPQGDKRPGMVLPPSVSLRAKEQLVASDDEHADSDDDDEAIGASSNRFKSQSFQQMTHRRIKRAKKLLQMYFQGCIAVLKKEFTEPQSAIIECRQNMQTGELEMIAPHKHDNRNDKGNKYSLEIRLCKVLDSSTYWNPLEGVMEDGSHKINNHGSSPFPKEYCNEYHSSHQSNGQRVYGEVERRASIFLPIGTTLVCMYLKSPDNFEQHGKFLASPSFFLSLLNC